jgi:hypothetical protein
VSDSEMMACLACGAVMAGPLIDVSARHEHVSLACKAPTCLFVDWCEAN